MIDGSNKNHNIFSDSCHIHLTSCQWLDSKCCFFTESGTQNLVVFSTENFERKTWVNHLQGQDREEIIVLKVVLVWLDCKLLFMDLISTMLNWSSYILAADHVAIWVRFYLNEAFNFGSFIVSWREKSKSARKSGFRVEFWKPVWCNRLEIQAQWAHKFEKKYDPS